MLIKLKGVCLLLASVFLAVSLVGQAVAEKYDTGPGNCLSLPVIWSEGVTKELRSADSMPVFDGESIVLEDVHWYLQQDENNIWQADSLSLEPGAGQVDVTTIDWGDNLEAHPWTIKSIVRTEVVLYQDISAAPMWGFEMAWLEGAGTSEVWGTNTTEYLSDLATVYSGVARYTIQKLEVDPYDDVTGLPIDNETLGLTWDATEGWNGPVGATLYNSAVWDAEGVDGKELASIYSAEINIPGKVIYGYNWNLKRANDGVGFYRITFSLDAFGGKEAPYPCNTFFTEGVTSIKLSENVEGGGIGVINYAENLTYIDVEITAK